MALAQREVTTAVVGLKHIAVFTFSCRSEGHLLDGDIRSVLDKDHTFLVRR